jgi:hypothetical protein
MIICDEVFVATYDSQCGLAEQRWSTERDTGVFSINQNSCWPKCAGIVLNVTQFFQRSLGLSGCG